MEIYDILKNDHEKMKGLLNELVGINDDEDERRKELIQEIRDDLIPHSRAEEAVLYNSMRMVDSTKKMAMQGYKDHMEAEGLLRALQALDKLDASWKTTAYKLKKALDNHVHEEETEIFLAAKNIFSPAEAQAMARTFEAMKPEIKEEGLMKTTLDMVANLMPPRFSERFRNYTVNPNV